MPKTFSSLSAPGWIILKENSIFNELKETQKKRDEIWWASIYLGGWFFSSFIDKTPKEWMNIVMDETTKFSLPQV